MVGGVETFASGLPYSNEYSITTLLCIFFSVIMIAAKKKKKKWNHIEINFQDQQSVLVSLNMISNYYSVHFIPCQEHTA